MSETIQAYPLQWPTGWKRAEPQARKRGAFSTTSTKYTETGSWRESKELTITQASERVRLELRRMGVSDHDLVISTNIPLRLDGMPRGDARNPEDPGVAAYWRKGNVTRCMAIDRYSRVTDNLAAIAATLEAMRAIERHGGAEILDRAFTGFTALPAPEQWFQVLGVPAMCSRQEVEAAYRSLAMKHHPDRGGTEQAMARINMARAEGLKEARG